MSDDLLTIFKETGALLEGHFKLSSGRHSDRYMQCARVLQYPQHARFLCSRLAESFRDLNATAVIAPALGGVIVAHEVAAALGIRAIFGERVDGRMTLRRGFAIEPDETLLVVEDVITTGKSTREIIELVISRSATVSGIGCLADRSVQSLDLPLQPVSLLQLDFPNWEPSECPLCQNDIPIISPGSRFNR
ncbi:orotate phosphoribosyltransferase [bacterium]|nr:orotate phosphoribosyltransferase [candidate division CSSED10-310 bacterium]